MPVINPPVPNDGENADAADVSIPIAAILGVINGAVDADNLADGAVTSAKLGSLAITTGKIADLAITTAKLADNTVTSDKAGVGLVVQTLMTSYNAVATSVGSTIPNDDTIPQITEGDEFMTIAITPKSTTSVLIVEALFYGANANANDIIAALFRDSTANAIAAVGIYQATPSGGVNIKVQAKVVSGALTATTFRLRAGAGSAGTTTFNGQTGARKFGTVDKSYISVREIKA